MSNLVLTIKEKQELLSLSQADLTISNINRLFGYTTKKTNDGTFVTAPPKFKQNSKFHLDANEYINKTAIDTNVGIFLFNKLLIEGKLEQFIPDGYFNQVIDKKQVTRLLGIFSGQLMKKQLDINPTLVKFLKDYEFYGLKLSAIFSSSYTEGFIRPNSELMKEKNEALKNADITDIQSMAKFEDSLVEKAKSKLKTDPAMSLFASKARGSFENDYKNMSLMVGPVPNPTTGKFDFVAANFTEGLKKEDLAVAGNIIVTSSFPKAIGTSKGGYLTKQFYAVYQSIVVDDPGTDCGTKECLEVILTEDNLDLYLYQNIKLPSGQLITLTDENYKSFINKITHIRTPMFCLTDKICSKCAGSRFEILDIKNVGLTSGRISNGLMNLRMKTKHSTKVTLDEVDPNDLLL